MVSGSRIGNRCVVPAFLAVALLTGCTGASTPNPAEGAAAEREVRAAEESRAAAIASGGPRDALYRADYIAIGGNSRVRDRAMALQVPRQPGYQQRDLVVRVVGNTALATGTSQGSAEARPERFMRLWVKDGDRWQLAAFHATPVSGTGSPAPVTRDPAAPGDASLTPTATGAEADVLRAQTERDAMFVGRDAAAYDRQTSASATRHRGNGAADAKVQLMDEFKAATGPGPVLTGPVVRVFGDMAVLYSLQGQPPTQRATRVWVREAGEWKYLHSSVSPIATAAPLPPELEAATKASYAAFDARDLTSWARLVGGDYTMVNAMGRLRDKAGRLAELKAAPPPASPGQRATELAMAYGDAAVVRVRTSDGYLLSVWAKGTSGWQVVAQQVVTAPTGPPPPPATGSTPGPEPAWIAPAGLTADAAAAFEAHVQIQQVGAAGDRNGYGRYTANEFIRIFPAGLLDRASMLARVTGRTGRPHDDVSVRTWDRVAVIRWRETSGTPAWVMRVMTRNPWGWQQAATVSTNVAAGR